MSQALLRIAKLIPRLGGASTDSEALTALRMIEKALAAESLTFVDAGMKLAEFVKTVLDVEDEPEIQAPPTNGHAAPPAWNHTGPSSRTHAHSATQGSASGWTHAQQQPPHHVNPNPPPRSPPPPPRPPWSHTPNLTDALYAERIEEILRSYNRHHVRTAKEKKFLEDMYFSFTSGFGGLTKLTSKQLDFLNNILDRLPV